MPRLSHLDAAESAFFARELEHVYSTTYDIKYPELMAATFIPVSSQAPAGAMQVTYQQFDRTGRAKVMGQGATDSPRVDVLGTEFPRPVLELSASYGWTLLEVRNAAMAGRPLDSKKASAARRAVETLLDEIATSGAPDYGIATGFVNDADVTIDAATGNWDAPLTADQIIADVSTMYQGIISDTNGVEFGDTLVLPDAQHALIATLPRGTQSDTTVLQYILRNFPRLQAVEPWYRLAGAGAAAVDRAVLYRRSAEHLTQEVPSPFEQLPVDQRGRNFTVETMATTAGTAFYYPLSARYMDGI